MRLIGSFQTITIQGTSGSVTSFCSGARSRAGAVVLTLLMASMVANPRGERKAECDSPVRPPDHLRQTDLALIRDAALGQAEVRVLAWGRPHGAAPVEGRRRLSPVRRVMPARSRCSSSGITV